MHLTTLQKAKTQMLLQQPFFATLLLSSPLIIDKTIPTAATDMRSIFYNPDFFAGLSVAQIQFVLAHEVMHIALLHGLRRGGRNPLRWNEAADYAINLTLKGSGFELLDGVLIDEQYLGMSAEVIYEKLQDEAKQQQQQQQGQGGGQGQGGQEPGQGQPGSPGAGQRGVLGPDLRELPEGGPEQVAEVTRQVRQKVAQAATMARMAGKLPGDLERLVGELLNPVVPWQELLRNFLQSAVQDDESWSRRNRRIRHIYLPARWSERLGKIGVIADTSGSIGEQEMQRIATEITAISEVMHPESIVVMWADTIVQRVEIIEAGDPVDLHPVGGGGTDLRVPLREMEAYEPEVVVMITDGVSPFGAAPAYPLITVCTTKAKIPFGAVVRV